MLDSEVSVGAVATVCEVKPDISVTMALTVSKTSFHNRNDMLTARMLRNGSCDGSHCALAFQQLSWRPRGTVYLVDANICAAVLASPGSSPPLTAPTSK